LKAIGKLAVDTNAVIAFRSGATGVCELIKSAEFVFVPAIVAGELLYGAANSQRVEENKRAVYTFLFYSSFIPIDEQITARYAMVRHQLKKIGRPLPENDIWIGATCLQIDVPLLTRDTHFQHIESLKVITWDV